MSDGPPIFGTEDDDFLQGTALSEEIYGLGGDDTIEGGEGDDLIDGGEGTDLLTGGAGDDVYIVDELDTVVEADGEGDDEVRTAATAFVLADHVERLTGLSADGQELVGNSLDNMILGGAGGDVLKGGLGNDVLDGGDGSDIYVFWRGEGDDSITVAPNTGHDSLQLLDVSMSNVTVSQSGYDLTLTIDEAGGSITLTGLGTSFTSLAEIIFADGTWSNADLLAYSTSTTGDGPDTLTGDANDNVIAGLGGDDVLDGAGGDDTLDGGDGDDILIGGSGDDVIEGGTGADRLAGNSGNDTFRFARGFGQDVIADADSSGGGGYDRIDLLDILPEDVTVTADGDSDLIIAINGTDDSIRLENVLVDPLAVIDVVAFADGTLWSGDYLIYLASPPPFLGTEADDVAVGGNLSDRLYGRGGDDSLSGGRGRDALIGGTGNDFLSGGEGADYYVFSAGDGNDVLFEYGGSGDGGQDEMDIYGYSRRDTTVARSADGLSYILYFGGGEESITLYGAASGDPANRVEWINFDETSIRGAALGSLAQDVGNGDDVITGVAGSYNSFRGLGGDDVVTGGDYTDSLKGDGGDDSLHGGDGDDYLLGGTGADMLDGGAGDDRLDGGAGADQMVGGSGDDSYVVDDLADSIVEAADGGTDVVGVFVAAYTLTADVENLVGQSDSGQALTGNDLDNGIFGGAGDDVLDGGAGDDQLGGGGGANIFRFARGGGNDIAGDEDWIADSIEFAAGILPENVGVRISGSKIILTLDDDGGSLTFQNVNGSPDRIEVRFQDGTVWTYADLVNHSLTGTEGDDVLSGNELDNVLSGRGGDDILNGGYGSDLLDGGAGRDLLTGDYGDDVLEGGEGDDDLYGGYDNDSLEGGVGDDVLIGDSGDDVLDGGAGDDDLYGGFDNDSLEGGAGNDVLSGDYGDDIFVGGAGDDELLGGYGADIYRFARGDGTDTVTVGDWDSGNAIEFAAGILTGDVTVSVSGSAILLTIDDDGGIIRLDYSMSSGGFLAYGMDAFQVRFEDGTVWSYEEILNRTLTGSEEADVLTGYERPNVLSGLGGDDVLIGGGANDSLEGGAGDDILNGGYGDDVYRFAPGFGSDVVQEAVPWSGGYDLIEFAGGILPGDVTVWTTDGGRDLIISIAGTADRIRLDDVNLFGTLSIDAVSFADGTVWTAGDLLALAVPAPPLANEYFGTAGDDVMIGGGSSEVLHGAAGDDSIEGGAGMDQLHGGLGADLLKGGEGNDFYYYEVGDGNDVIREFEGAGSGGYDTLQLGPGLQRQDMTIGLSADGLSYVLFFGGGEESVTLYGAASAGSGYALESIRFSDGDWLTATYLASFAANVGNGDDILAANPGGPPVRGLGGDDTIEGSWWLDMLKGDAGDDVLSGADGNDELDGGEGSDLLIGGTGDDIYLIDSLDSLVELPDEGRDEVRTAASVYLLGDNFEWLTGLSQDGQALTGNALDNRITGGSGDDVLRGGLGDDHLEGGGGSNLFLFARGDGNDKVGVYWGPLDDAILFDSDILPADVTIGLSDDGIVLTVDDGGGSITLTSGLPSFTNLSEVIFSDGTVWSRAYLIAQAMIPDEGPNWIIGDANNNIIDGLGGADRIDGGFGDDILYGGAGDDILTGGWGKDVTTGGSGADVFKFREWDLAGGPWADRITDFAAGEDKIDLSGIDANYGSWSDDAFTFIGSAAFSHTPGELRVVFDGTDTRIQMDPSGQGYFQWEIVLTGNVVVAASDFVL